ncbi:MAG: hypothetical protein QF486_02265 [Candidatus Woesearchaeota archaeon]|jgi:hypothetical protein|nr:hypothetical protein [Candidatus Woesearchaeota archaeon]
MDRIPLQVQELLENIRRVYKVTADQTKALKVTLGETGTLLQAIQDLKGGLFRNKKAKLGLLAHQNAIKLLMVKAQTQMQRLRVLADANYWTQQEERLRTLLEGDLGEEDVKTIIQILSKQKMLISMSDEQRTLLARRIKKCAHSIRAILGGYPPDLDEMWAHTSSRLAVLTEADFKQAQKLALDCVVDLESVATSVRRFTRFLEVSINKVDSEQAASRKLVDEFESEMASMRDIEVNENDLKEFQELALRDKTVYESKKQAVLRMLPQVRGMNGTISEDQLILCRSMDFLPKNGVAQTSFAKTTSEYGVMWCGTLHFCLNGPVTSHGFRDMPDQKYALLIPLPPIMHLVVNITPYDTYTVGHVPLPTGSELLIPYEDYNDPEKRSVAERSAGNAEVLSKHQGETNEQAMRRRVVARGYTPLRHSSKYSNLEEDSALHKEQISPFVDIGKKSKSWGKDFGRHFDTIWTGVELGLESAFDTLQKKPSPEWASEAGQRYEQMDACITSMIEYHEQFGGDWESYERMIKTAIRFKAALKKRIQKFDPSFETAVA